MYSRELASFRDSDNDVMYVVGGRLEMNNSVLSFAMDDGLDSGTGEGGILLIHNCLFDSIWHEGVALSNQGFRGKHVVIQNTRGISV